MTGDPLAAALLIVKLVLYPSALLAAGVGLHVGLGVVEPGARSAALRRAALFALLAAAAGAVRLLLVSAQLGGDIARLFDATSLSWTWGAHGAAQLALLGGAAGFVLAALLGRGWPATIGAAGLCASFALTGHSQALADPGAAPLAVGLHVALAAFWAAAPLTLWPFSGARHECVLARSQRFSAWAVFAVPALFVAGGWLAWTLAGGAEGLTGTLYGRLMLAKLGAAGLALGLGALNKTVATRMLIAAPSRGRALLRRTLTAEAILFGAAFGLVAWATTMTGPAEI